MRSLGGFRRSRPSIQHAEKTRKKPSTEALQTDRQTDTEERILTAFDLSSLPVGLCRQRGHSGSGERAERASSETAPCSGCQSHLGVPHTPPSPPRAAAAAAAAQLRAALASAPARLRSRLRALCSGSQRIPAHPRLTHLAAEAQLLPPRARGTAAHGRRMPKAAGEHLGAGREGMPARALAVLE